MDRSKRYYYSKCIRYSFADASSIVNPRITAAWLHIAVLYDKKVKSHSKTKGDCERIVPNAKWQIARRIDF